MDYIIRTLITDEALLGRVRCNAGNSATAVAAAANTINIPNHKLSIYSVCDGRVEAIDNLENWLLRNEGREVPVEYIPHKWLSSK